MNNDTKRRIVFGLLSLVLSLLATRLAVFLTDMLLGKEENELLT
jgi:hypothetical protein